MNHKHESLDGNEREEASSEKLTALQNTVKTFLGQLEPAIVTPFDEDEILSLAHYDTSIALPRSGGLLNVFGSVIIHKDYGIVTPSYLSISHGSERFGPACNNMFDLTTFDRAVQQEFSVKGREVVNSDVAMRFVDTAAIKNRSAELMADPDFSPTSFPSGIVLPDMQVTPAGDIYDNGEVLVDQAQVGAVAVKFTVHLTDPEKTAAMQRILTADEQARKEVSSLVTDERAEHVIATLAEALEAIPIPPEQS